MRRRRKPSESVISQVPQAGRRQRCKQTRTLLDSRQRPHHVATAPRWLGHRPTSRLCRPSALLEVKAWHPRRDPETPKSPSSWTQFHPHSTRESCSLPAPTLPGRVLLSRPQGVSEGSPTVSWLPGFSGSSLSCRGGCQSLTLRHCCSFHSKTLRPPGCSFQGQAQSDRNPLRLCPSATHFHLSVPAA